MNPSMYGCMHSRKQVDDWDYAVQKCMFKEEDMHAHGHMKITALLDQDLQLALDDAKSR